MNIHTEPKPSDSVPVNIDMMFDRYADMIYRIALLRTRNRSDAEDIVQEVFLRWLKSTPRFTSEEHCKSWFIRVALNCSHSLIGSKWHLNIVPSDEVGAICADMDRASSEVYTAVLELPLKYRTAIHLFYYEGYKVKEIAKMMHTRENTVKSWLLRAREMLREVLKEEE